MAKSIYPTENRIKTTTTYSLTSPGQMENSIQKPRSESTSEAEREQKRGFDRIGGSGTKRAFLAEMRLEHSNTYAEGVATQPRELEISCLREYEEIIELCSSRKLKKDVEKVIESVDAELEDLIKCLNTFRTNLRANWVEQVQQPLTESELQRYEQLKSDISVLAPELSLIEFKDKKFSAKFDNYLHNIKEFNAFSAKAKHRYQQQIDSIRGVQSKISTLVSSSKMAFDMFTQSYQEDRKTPDNDRYDHDVSLFTFPERLEVTKRVDVELSNVLKGACFIPEDNLLALGGTTEIALFEWPSLAHVHTSQLCHEKQIIRLVYSRLLKKLISCSADNTVKLWNLNGKSLNRYKKYEHPGAVYAVEIMEESQKIIVAGQFPVIYIWNLFDDSYRLIEENFRAPIFAIKYINYSKSLAVANSQDGSIWIYSLVDLQCKYKLSGHSQEKPIWFLDYYPKEDLLYSAGSDGIVNVWSGKNAKNFALKKKISLGQSNLTEICSACSNEKVIALSSDENESSLVVSDGKAGKPTIVVDFPNLTTSIMLHDPKRKELLVAANGFDGICSLFVIAQKKKTTGSNVRKYSEPCF